MTTSTIKIVPHPKDIIDVDPEILEDMKKKLNSPEMSKEEKEASDEQDRLER